MSIKNLVPISGVIVAVMCGCTDSTQTDGKPRIQEIPHTVLSDDVTEGPGKTQVIQNLLVKPDITERDLRHLLIGRYEEASKRTGFRFHDHPTVVGVYAYPSREHAESGMGQWLGMLIKSPNEAAPRITVHDSVGTPSVEELRFGLSEGQRRDVFKQIVLAEDRGQKEAERKHPTDVIKQASVVSELSKANKEALAKELKLTREQLQEISTEGLMKNWPMPKW